jgi:hypothetical protein
MSAPASPLAAHASNAFATRHGAVNRPLWLWLCIGVLGYLALPWYAQQDTNGLLAVGPDAQGRQRVLAAGAWSDLAPRFGGRNK